MQTHRTLSDTLPQARTHGERTDGQKPEGGVTGTTKGDGDQEAVVPAGRLTPHTMTLNPIGYDTSSYQAFLHFVHLFTFRITAASHVHSNGVSACTTAKALPSQPAA